MNTSIILRTIHKISDVSHPRMGEIYHESSSGNQYVYDGRNFINLRTSNDIVYSDPSHRTLVLDSEYPILERIRLTLLTNERLKGSKFGSRVYRILLTRRFIQIITKDNYIIELMNIDKYSDNLTGSLVDFKVNRISDMNSRLLRMYVPDNTPTNTDIYEVLITSIDEVMRQIYDNI